MYFTIFQVQVRTGRALSKYDLSRQLRGRNEDKLKTLLIFKLLTYVVKSLTHCWCQDFNGPPNCSVKSVKNPYEYYGHQSSLHFFFSLVILVFNKNIDISKYMVQYNFHDLAKQVVVKVMIGILKCWTHWWISWIFYYNKLDLIYAWMHCIALCKYNLN